MNKGSDLPRDLSFEEITVGYEVRFERSISAEDIAAFARLSGDHNPLHVDRAFGEASRFGGNIAHGLLLGSFFSTLVGMYCPGKRSLYLSQTLNFKNPVKPGDPIVIQGVVTDKSEATRLVTIKTEILSNGRVVVDGEAKVRVL